LYAFIDKSEVWIESWKWRFIYLLCLIFSGDGVLGVAVGDGDWNCQETRLLCDIPLSDKQWRSLSCSAAISLSSCTIPGGSREYLAASLATSSRHNTTFRGWPCKTIKRRITLKILEQRLVMNDFVKILRERKI